MTDPDSAKMVSGRGVIQGYNGVVVADAKHQIIVGAEAIGDTNEAKALVGRSGYKRKYFGASEFVLDRDKGKLVCPAGKELYVKDSNFETHNGYHGIVYSGKKTDCRVCDLRRDVYVKLPPR